MDKNAIKSFAIESRRQMIESVKYQASLIGITADSINEPISKAEGMETYDFGAGTYTIYDEDIEKRKSLVKEIKNKGYNNVLEEVAYTWFNRIIAIRFMEVNDYLPTRTRVISSEIPGKIEPDIISEALDLDLGFTIEDRELILKLKDENKLDELFQFLFIKQCNKLNEILPGLFETTNDYMELLLNISFTMEEGIVRTLVDSIDEEEFAEQVEIIGWLYQFYNSELKDETFSNLKKGKKITKERIPSATQLFTPGWIVKYMVENSLGRLWLEGHPDVNLKSKWKYYIEEAEQQQDVEIELSKRKNLFKNTNLENIKIIDPCMGSGHILSYIFDVLMDMYVSEGYTKNEAAISILKNNIYGLDIDKRAYQLSYFAILMKARKYNRKIFKEDINPLVYPIDESNNVSVELIEKISLNTDMTNTLKKIHDSFIDAKNYGSILKIEPFDLNNIFNAIEKFESNNNSLTSELYNEELSLFKNILIQADILSKKYDIVITNPPYMGNRGMESKLKNYLKKNFPDSKSDLSTVFMEKCFSFSKEYGFIAMINIPVWMFISTYEKLRYKFIHSNSFINMLHFGRGIFGSDFGTTSFVMNNSKINGYKSTYRQLYLDKGAVDSIDQKEKWFFDKTFNKFVMNQDDFTKIPGSPIAYWISNDIINCFDNESLGDYSEVITGMTTGNNNSYLRHWHEVNSNNILFGCGDMNQVDLTKTYWIPYNKGGERRNWYGNNEYVVNWAEKDNFNRPKKTLSRLYLKKGLTWSFVTSGKFSMRYFPEGYLWDVSGSPAFFSNDDYLYYSLGLLCTNFTNYLLNLINPTVSIQAIDLKKIPFIFDETELEHITELVKDNINLVKYDWDSFETSWDFLKSPLLNGNSNLLSERYEEYKIHKEQLFNTLKYNEIKLNKIYNSIYNVGIDENVEDKYVSMSMPNYEKDIKYFISYAVGCMLGRYSLDNEGLQYAGGEFNLDNYSLFVPDDDNIIPILDLEYFEDDIVGYFVKFVKLCFGEEVLEENLEFISHALNKKGKTSREIIRNYFLEDFFKDHVKLYKRCPIYWQFDSGKQNAFKCIIYMHRYQPNLIARVRTDYLHKTQKAIEQNLSHCENIISNSSNKSEISKATKDKSKYIKQLDEIRAYDEALGHMANQHIEIDLDDGVKVNYAKFQKIEVSREGEKTKKVNLLKNI
ncbi:BREX-1 system adenine-specific DNA-methyltransferase PglX [uncultured Methanobrevibacter sp.]|uniref:BREX-1 system adenine-specific DNA-methyltransferase PglX n=1 Tax=uncultured Methanobrevibacter sp. TaxID=253161 RepID=UPI0025D57AF5|nr:BREX-1 system adenine-specific DNA-methyltransferase PglX [uncultured Methanobrevibacter sp.]